MKNYRTEFLLSLLLGWCGGHKFYRGKYGLGIIYLLTFGLFFFGWIYDTVKLGIVAFKYTEEQQLKYYESKLQKEEAKKQQFLEYRQKRVKVANNQVCCPKCGSSQLTANKKGFSLGKALVGGLVLVPVAGVATGMLGKNKIIITCLSCGKQFKPGRGN